MGILDRLRGRRTSPAGPVAHVPALRLADPNHPARAQLDRAAVILDRCVRVEVVDDRTMTQISAPAGEMSEALASLEDAIARSSADPDVLVAKACVQYATAQFGSAEETLDLVLGRDPGHFEAAMWKAHWETWSNALRCPGWDEGERTLHPVMAAHLKAEHRVQLIRDGLQKALAIVAAVQGPPFDSRTQVKVEWILSKTPYGPLVAYYTRVIEPSGEPSTTEAFLPMFQPTFSPMEGYCLFQQLAFTPYCFVVLVDGDTVMLNRRVVFGGKATARLRAMTAQVASSRAFLPQHQFRNATQWHMDNFDMRSLRFE